MHVYAITGFKLAIVHMLGDFRTAGIVISSTPMPVVMLVAIFILAPTPILMSQPPRLLRSLTPLTLTPVPIPTTVPTSPPVPIFNPSAICDPSARFNPGASATLCISCADLLLEPMGTIRDELSCRS